MDNVFKYHIFKYLPFFVIYYRFVLSESVFYSQKGVCNAGVVVVEQLGTRTALYWIHLSAGRCSNILLQPLLVPNYIVLYIFLDTPIIYERWLAAYRCGQDHF